MSKEKYIAPLVLSVRSVEYHGLIAESAGASTEDAGDTPTGPGGVNDDDLVKEYSGFDGDDFSVGPWE